MATVQNIIFSRNRAFQLDALLRSLEVHDPGAMSQVMTTVLYRYDPGPHLDSLVTLQKDFPWVSKWVAETNFRDQVLDLVREPSCPVTMFMVDDMVVKGPTPWLHAQELLQHNPRVLNIQLRLGEGISWCYPLSRRQAIPPLFDFGIWKLWRWFGADGDWGYPMSVDGAIWRTSEIRHMLENTQFSNPNTLEANLQAWNQPYENKGAQICACLPKSRVFNIPSNRVQDEFRNRCGSTYTADDLLKLYQNGFRVDVGPFWEVDNNDSHFELDYALVRLSETGKLP